MPYVNDSISDFEIIQVGRKSYKVFYKSPTTGKVWEQLTDDHDLIQNIMDGKALISNLRKLKFICKLWKQLNNYLMIMAWIAILM